MDYSAFINLNSLSEEAQAELKSFYEYLIFKYKKKKTKEPEKTNKQKELEEFANNHLIKMPTGFKFNREEAHER